MQFIKPELKIYLFAIRQSKCYNKNRNLKIYENHVIPVILTIRLIPLNLETILIPYNIDV